MSGLGDFTKDIAKQKNREKIKSLKNAQGYKPQGLDGSIEDMTLHQLVSIVHGNRECRIRYVFDS